MEHDLNAIVTTFSLKKNQLWIGISYSSAMTIFLSSVTYLILAGVWITKLWYDLPTFEKDTLT